MFFFHIFILYYQPLQAKYKDYLTSSKNETGPEYFPKYYEVLTH
jgi:hypothetical protein